MSTEEVRNFLHAGPFKPFTIHAAEQTSIEIPHPDFALITRSGVLVVNTEAGKLRHIDIGSITSISAEADAELKK